ncbi:hypothetical protein Tco_0821244 [Tanacetum coccineum]|uniref:Integrase, catalytic region, zinc finger, CCHC-type, peptidase aspartic, catalytic n=1 Tax=Tanacetum coccineum TaxID=301880 RepID=A0ABQ5ABQ5_9ASTR
MISIHTSLNSLLQLLQSCLLWKRKVLQQELITVLLCSKRVIIAHGRVFGTVEVPATPTTTAYTRDITYKDLTNKEKIREACDIRATNIVLQGLPPDVYTNVNHHTIAKEIWDRVKLLIEGTELSLQEQESKLYNEFDRFTFEKGETIHSYYLRFSQIINDMNTIGMIMKKLQDMHELSFDKLYAYLRQHEVHANEVRMMRQRFPDPLALMRSKQPRAINDPRTITCFSSIRWYQSLVALDLGSTSYGRKENADWQRISDSFVTDKALLKTWEEGVILTVTISDREEFWFSAEPPTWGRRIRLALQTAKAVETLPLCVPLVIHRDIKSAANFSNNATYIPELINLDLPKWRSSITR